MSRPVPYSSLFEDDVPPLRIETHLSLPAVLSTMVLLVDYVATNSTVPTLWPWDVWERFTPEEGTARARISPLLVHGLILQEHWLRTISARDAAQDNWPMLRLTIADLSDHDIRRLLAEGWLSGARFYLTEMVRSEEVDRYLPESADQLTVDDLLKDPDLLDSLHAFTYVSWGVRENQLNDYVSFARNPAEVRRALLQLLDAVWRHGGKGLWQRERSRLQAWTECARDRIAVERWSDGVAAVRELTGRTPPKRLQPQIRAARRLVLHPCLQLGSTQTIDAADGTVHLMFEPPARSGVDAGMATDSMRLADAVSLVRAMSDPAAFSLLQTINDQGELYALEVAEKSGIHQSTVSRHLNMLERNAIVSVRREGKAKYYRLRQDRIDLAMRVIREALDD